MTYWALFTSPLNNSLWLKRESWLELSPGRSMAKCLASSLAIGPCTGCTGWGTASRKIICGLNIPSRNASRSVPATSLNVGSTFCSWRSIFASGENPQKRTRSYHFMCWSTGKPRLKNQRLSPVRQRPRHRPNKQWLSLSRQKSAAATNSNACGEKCADSLAQLPKSPCSWLSQRPKVSWVSNPSNQKYDDNEINHSDTF